MKIYEVFYPSDEPTSEFYVTKAEAKYAHRLSEGIAILVVHDIVPNREGIVRLLNHLSLTDR